MKQLFFILIFLATSCTIRAQVNNEGQMIIPDSIVQLLITELEPMENDSIKALADSLSMRIDSLNIAPGTLTHDSIPTDSIKAPNDSLIVESDTVKIAADSVKIKKALHKPLPEVLRFNRLLSNYRLYYNDWAERWSDIYIISSDIKSNPDFYKYMMPATYYHAPIHEATCIDNWEPSIPFIKKEKAETDNLADMRTSEKVDRYVNQQLLSFYLAYPNLVTKNESSLKDMDPLSKEMVVTEHKTEDLRNMINVNEHSGMVTDKDLLVFKPNFWVFGGNGYVQFSQHHISDNWYKGGESTKSLLSGVVLQANYDDKRNVQFENRLEWKLGFTTTPSDTLHSYRANNDMLRLNSKVGFKAIKNWYYTLSLEFKTQFFSNYATNSNDLASTFFSPAELNVGLGMDYKFVKDGQCNLSVLINPFNYTLHSVASNRVDPTKFNIEKGKKIENVIGSRLEGLLKWKIFKDLVWESRLSYLTNYEKVLAEWENTFTFNFNKYISSKLFIHTRFDDGAKRHEDDSYFQLQELLSIGLNYTW